MEEFYERISAQDRSFLHFEDATTHMHLGGLVVFEVGPLRTPEGGVDIERIRAQIEARDREIDNPYVKDSQVMNLHNARRYIGDRLIRTAKPHRILDPGHGPLIAVKLNILTRKTLGGFETDLDSRVFGQDGKVVAGLYAAGEAAGFGGGGMHGYRSLEGTFLGGCLFSGRNAGRAAARAVG